MRRRTFLLAAAALLVARTPVFGQAAAQSDSASSPPAWGPALSGPPLGCWGRLGCCVELAPPVGARVARDGPHSSLAAVRGDLVKAVAAVEPSRRGSRWKEGVAIGAALGAATGLALSLAAPEEPEGISMGTAILLGTAAFAVLGAVAGGLVGALIPVH